MREEMQAERNVVTGGDHSRCGRGRRGGSGVGPFGVEAPGEKFHAVAVGEVVDADFGRVDGAVEGGKEDPGVFGAEVVEEFFLVGPLLGEEEGVVVFAVGVEVAVEAAGGGAEGPENSREGADHLGAVGGIDSKTCSQQNHRQRAVVCGAAGPFGAPL